jgi:ATP-dependent Clp protease protease subunit
VSLLQQNPELESDESREPSVDMSRSYLHDAGTFYLCGEIEAGTVGPCIEWILEEGLRKRHTRLDLVVNSIGGDVSEAFALIDIMAGSIIPIHTLGIGMVASAGLLVFMHGERRILTRNTLLLSHQHSTGGIEGKYHELLAERKAEDWLNERLTAMYRQCTGLSKREVQKFLLGPSDTYLTAAQAKKLGLCDVVK